MLLNFNEELQGISSKLINTYLKGNNLFTYLFTSSLTSLKINLLRRVSLCWTLAFPPASNNQSLLSILNVLPNFRFCKCCFSFK